MQYSKGQLYYNTVDQEWTCSVTIDGHTTWFSNSTSSSACQQAADEYLTAVLVHAARLTPVAALTTTNDLTALTRTERGRQVSAQVYATWDAATAGALRLLMTNSLKGGLP